MHLTKGRPKELSGRTAREIRVYDLLDELEKEADAKVYLLVAHNGVARAVQSYFSDMTNSEFAKFGIRNCELRKFSY